MAYSISSAGLRIEMPQLEIEMPQLEIEMPQLEIEIPQLERNRLRRRFIYCLAGGN